MAIVSLNSELKPSTVQSLTSSLINLCAFIGHGRKNVPPEPQVRFISPAIALPVALPVLSSTEPLFRFVPAGVPDRIDIYTF